MAAALDAASNTLSKNLGRLLVRHTTSAGGIQMIPVEVVVELDANSIEREPDGSIEFAYLVFEARYDPNRFGAEERARFYRDASINAAIDNFLRDCGLAGGVGWSEMGRQQPGVMDFDADLALVDELWPELAPSPSPQI